MARKRPVTMGSGLGWLRYGLPLALAAAGVIVAVAWSATVGIGLVAVAAAVFVANLYVRLSLSSQDDRAAEARARRAFERTGRWPD
jgi:Flp pilus assembly protein TadB